MWEPFTERARRSIVLAQEEAQRLGDTDLGTEHLLLGIISEGESVAANVLERMGVILPKVREEVETLVGKGSPLEVMPEVEFTPRAKRVIELAFEEAKRFEHNYIGTEHLLLGILRDGEGVAFRVLTNLKVSVEVVRGKVLAVLGRKETPPRKSISNPVQTYEKVYHLLTKTEQELRTLKNEVFQHLVTLKTK